MAESSGIHPYGSKIEYSDDDITYTVLGEVTDIDPPKEKVMVAKATHLQSDNAAKEKKPGLSETDKCTVTVNFTKAQYTTLKAMRRASKYWRISAPLDTGETTPSRWKFRGFWTSIGPEKLVPDAEQVIQVTLEIEVTGIVTYTAGT